MVTNDIPEDRIEVLPHIEEGGSTGTMGICITTATGRFMYLFATYSETEGSPITEHLSMSTVWKRRTEAIKTCAAGHMDSPVIPVWGLQRAHPRRSRQSGAHTQALAACAFAWPTGFCQALPGRYGNHHRQHHNPQRTLWRRHSHLVPWACNCKGRGRVDQCPQKEAICARSVPN